MPKTGFIPILALLICMTTCTNVQWMVAKEFDDSTTQFLQQARIVEIPAGSLRRTLHPGMRLDASMIFSIGSRYDHNATEPSCMLDAFIMEVPSLTSGSDTSLWAWNNISAVMDIARVPETIRDFKMSHVTLMNSYLFLLGGYTCSSGTLNKRIFSFSMFDLSWLVVSENHGGVHSGDVDAAVAKGNKIFIRYQQETSLYVVDAGHYEVDYSVDWALLNTEPSYRAADLLKMVITEQNLLFIYGLFTSSDVGHVGYDVSDVIRARGISEIDDSESMEALYFENVPKLEGPALMSYRNHVLLFGGGLEQYFTTTYDNYYLIDTERSKVFSLSNAGLQGFANSFGIQQESSAIILGGRLFNGSDLVPNKKLLKGALDLSSYLDYVNITTRMRRTTSTSLRPKPTVVEAAVDAPRRTLQDFINEQPASVIGALIGVLVLAIVAIGTACYYTISRRRNRKARASAENYFVSHIIAGQEPSTIRTAQPEETKNIFTTNMGTLLTQGKSLALPGFLMLMKDLDFVFDEEIGEGGAGVIYKGQLTNQQALQRSGGDSGIVVKIMKKFDEASEDDMRNLFQQEVAVMWLLHESKNIIQLRGYCPEPPIIIMKYYKLGSLEYLIHDRKHAEGLVSENQWTPKFVIRMMGDISSALAYMHEIGLTHNDVKPGNILMDRDDANGQLIAVLCDFGVTEIYNTNLLRVKAYERSRVKGASLVYAAPEVLKKAQINKGDQVQKEEACGPDIYAFAMIVFELIYRRIPWWDVNDLEDIKNRVIRGERPQLPRALADRREADPYLDAIMSTMERCWNPSPYKRQPMAQVAQMCNNVLRESL